MVEPRNTNGHAKCRANVAMVYDLRRVMCSTSRSWGKYLFSNYQYRNLTIRILVIISKL